MNEFNGLIEFFGQYGLWLTVIAILGIAVLGVLKYCNVFSKLEEQIRHLVYMIIALALVAIGDAVYLVWIDAFDVKYFVAVLSATYVLNQTFYNIFKVTKLRDLFTKILTWILHFFDKSQA